MAGRFLPGILEVNATWIDEGQVYSNSQGRFLSWLWMGVSLLALPLLVWQRSLVDSAFWPMGDWENWNIQKGDVWNKQRSMVLTCDLMI